MKEKKTKMNDKVLDTRLERVFECGMNVDVEATFCLAFLKIICYHLLFQKVVPFLTHSKEFKEWVQKGTIYLKEEKKLRIIQKKAN